MYRLELTATDKNETLLKSIDLETWTDTFKEIENLQKMQLENTKIDLFKYNNENDLQDGFYNVEHCGEFTNIKMTKRPKPKKQRRYSNYIIFLELLFFPIMLLKEISKEL